MTAPYLFLSMGAKASFLANYAANLMPTNKCKNTFKKNAAPKGRIKSEWIAELFLQMLIVIIPSSTAEELIAGLCWLVPASPVLPGSKPAPYSIQLIQPQYPHH